MSEVKAKILLVDDEPDILEIISYNLIAQGYNVSTANNGVQAVKKAKKEKAQSTQTYTPTKTQRVPFMV